MLESKVDCLERELRRTKELMCMLELLLAQTKAALNAVVQTKKLIGAQTLRVRMRTLVKIVLMKRRH